MTISRPTTKTHFRTYQARLVLSLYYVLSDIGTLVEQVLACESDPFLIKTTDIKNKTVREQIEIYKCGAGGGPARTLSPGGLHPDANLVGCTLLPVTDVLKICIVLIQLHPLPWLL